MKASPKQSNKIGVVGDMHMKDGLSYADYIDDGRTAEKQAVLDFIVDTFADCQHVVFMGDNFHSKNNSSETNREFVAFIERFSGKHVYLLAGNHEKKGDGKTAIDFLGEVERPNWHVFTTPGSMQMGLLKADFLPYMLNSELAVETSEKAAAKMVKELDTGDILFAHHAISGTLFNGIKTDLLKEVVLPKEKLEKKYKRVIAGHIHDPQRYGNTLITGSVFCSEVGETEKFIYTIDDELNIKEFPVPARGIYKLTDPTIAQLLKVPPHSIVKVVVTDKERSLEEIKTTLDRFDASLLIEDYPDERVKMHIEEGAMDFSIEALLKLYSDARTVDHEKLLHGLHLISE